MKPIDICAFNKNNNLTYKKKYLGISKLSLLEIFSLKEVAFYAFKFEILWDMFRTSENKS